MNVLHEKPPNWDEINKLFKLPEGDPVYFSYGDCCYNPEAYPMSAELIRHEETHLEQQGHDRTAAKIWWQRFLIDPEWRVEQEAEAYGAQYAFYCTRVKDREKRFHYLHGVARQLASPMYGSVIKHAEAMKKIKGYAQGGALLNIEDELK